MKDFLFLFRNDYEAMASRWAEGAPAIMKEWESWLGNIAAQNKLSDKGNRLDVRGKVVKPGNIVTDGPYAEMKELVGGYIAVKAGSYEEAAEMAKGCPILLVGGNVEVREIIPM